MGGLLHLVQRGGDWVGVWPVMSLKVRCKYRFNCYAPARRVGGIKRCFCPSVCPSVCRVHSE